MSLCLRPVIEKWGESYTYSISHDEVVNLLCEVAARADAGESWQREYGDLTVVGIEKGGRFLDFLSAGRHAMYKARKEGRANYDLTGDEIETVEQMEGMGHQPGVNRLIPTTASCGFTLTEHPPKRRAGLRNPVDQRRRVRREFHSRTRLGFWNGMHPGGVGPYACTDVRHHPCRTGVRPGSVLQVCRAGSSAATPEPAPFAEP